MVSLKAKRQELLLSVRDLAKAADVSPQTIVSIEARRLSPRPQTMRQIAKALDTDPREIDEFRDAIAKWVEGGDD